MFSNAITNAIFWGLFILNIGVFFWGMGYEASMLFVLVGLISWLHSD